jgi:drug/metabolite transporter (DMT)-like permease
VCFFWGTTYLGIRVALESFSPAMLMCLRYLLSGGLMLAAAALSGAAFPGRDELWKTALYGVVTIGLGTGSLAVAEQWIPSSLAAMIVTTQPFWMVGVEAFVNKEPLHAPTLRAMLIGVAGVVVLFWPTLAGGDASGVSAQSVLSGFLVLQFGAAMWSVGSIGQRNLRSQIHPFVSGAIQQLATGVVFAVPAWWGPHPAAWPLTPVIAVVYLAIFGGIVGYSSYIYSMHHLPVALVSVYTYVNPIVAVILGMLYYGEPFGWREGAAMLVIFTGVWAVKRASAPLGRPAPVE